MRRRRSLNTWLLAGAWCATTAGVTLGGCSLATDLSGLTTGSGPGTERETEGGPTEPPSEAGEGGSDAGDGAIEGGGESPCAFAHAFCADFDNGPLAEGWTSVSNDPPGSLELDGLARSAPRSLRVRQPRKTGGADVINAVTKSLPGPWRRLVFQGDVYLEPPAWQAGDINVALLVVLFVSSSMTTGTDVFFAETDVVGTVEHLAEGPPRYMRMPPLPYKTWTHLLVDFDPGGKLHYEIDGKSYDRVFSPVTAGSNPSITLDVGGISWNEPAPAVDIRWDNVLVDFP